VPLTPQFLTQKTREFDGLLKIPLRLMTKQSGTVYYSPGIFHFSKRVDTFGLVKKNKAQFFPVMRAVHSCQTLTADHIILVTPLMGS
jgi:hypothetical protein